MGTDEKKKRATCGSIAGTVDPKTGEPCEACEALPWGVWAMSFTASDCEERLGEVGPHHIMDLSDRACFCYNCGAELSFDAEGQPTATQMVPKDALEWLAKHRNLSGCPAEWNLYPVPCSEDGECSYRDDTPACWVVVALAAEETNP